MKKMEVVMKNQERVWPRYFVDTVLRDLAGIVPKGTPIKFELDGSACWAGSEGVNSLEFTCPQCYSAEEAQQAERKS